MEQIEDGKVDHNVLAVLPGEKLNVDIDIKQTLTEFVRHVFDHIPEKDMRTGDFLEWRAAIEHIARYRD
jgi:hypothetical protein